MRIILLLAALGAAAWAAPDRRGRPLAELTSGVAILKEGRWRIAMGGVLCNACTKAIVEEFLRVDGVAKAAFDFEDGFLHLTVARGKQARGAALDRALRLAWRRVDLATKFNMAEAHYEGPDLGGPAPKRLNPVDALKLPAAPATLEPTP
ncbi:MAG: hypothetical protein HYZ75_06285 [Elusimicrobia bacterium]|nr:hypothetical protein [Elusimicrobiota bacterium]